MMCEYVIRLNWRPRWCFGVSSGLFSASLRSKEQAAAYLVYMCTTEGRCSRWHDIRQTSGVRLRDPRLRAPRGRQHSTPR
jgi:hypothetical protein